MKKDQTNVALTIADKAVQQTIEKPDLKVLIEQERKERIERCGKRLQQLLEEEKCTLEVAMLVTMRGNIPQITVVSTE